jgi:hypothetical protein
MGALLLSSIPAFAQDFGPPMPYAQKGKLAVAGGFARSMSEWVVEGHDDKVGDATSNLLYLQGSYGLWKGTECYARVGIANLSIEYDPDVWTADFEGDYAAFMSIGLKSLFKTHLPVMMGPFVQYTFYSDYEDDDVAGAKVEYDEVYDLSMGVSLQRQVSMVTVYGGAFAYWSKATERWTHVPPPSASGHTDVCDFAEDGSVGGFGGLNVPVTGCIKFNVEGQYKSDISFSVSLNMALAAMGK